MDPKREQEPPPCCSHPVPPRHAARAPLGPPAPPLCFQPRFLGMKSLESDQTLSKQPQIRAFKASHQASSPGRAKSSFQPAALGNPALGVRRGLLSLLSPPCATGTGPRAEEREVPGRAQPLHAQLRSHQHPEAPGPAPPAPPAGLRWHREDKTSSGTRPSACPRWEQKHPISFGSELLTTRLSFLPVRDTHLQSAYICT